MKRFCLCGADISHYAAHLRKCYSCRMTTAEPKSCKDCREPHHRRMSQRCEPCSRARGLFTDYASGRALAASHVARARRLKQLPSPRLFACADCGAPATCHDHRDYGAPLQVEPVCHGCNIRRRAARPKPWTFAEFMEWFTTSKTCARFVEFFGPDVFARLERHHFNGPGGIAQRS